MTSNEERIPTNRWIAAAAVAVAFAAFSLLDMGNVGHSGLSAAGGRVVSQVTPGSPAEAADFRAGDRILRNGGIDASDLGALLRQPPPRVGATRSYRVERDGEAAPLEKTLTFPPLPSTQKALRWAATLVGFAFLAFGLGGYFRSPSPTTRLLALLGLCALPIFVAPPFLSSATARLLLLFGQVVLSVLLPALILHFFLRFPRPRPFLDRPLGKALLYGPAALGSLLAFLTLFGVPSLFPVTNAVTLGSTLIQIVFAIGVLIHSFVKASPEERNRHGLGVVLAALLVGVLPAVVGGFVPTLPGASFYFLSTLVIPAALAWAAVREDGATTARLQPQAL